MNAITSFAMKAVMMVVFAALGTSLSGCAPVWGIPLVLGGSAFAMYESTHTGPDTKTASAQSAQNADASAAADSASESSKGNSIVR